MKFLLTFILVLTASISTHASESLSYSGRLVNTDGSPVSGPVNLRFELAYSDAPATILCHKDLTGVVLSNGVFHSKLDFAPTDCMTPTATPLSVILAGANAGETTVIRVTDLTNTKTYSFQAFHSVPFAMIADSAKTLAPLGAGDTGKVLQWNGTIWTPATLGSGTGSVNNVSTGTGLTGGPITTTGTISIANGGVNTTQLADGAVTDIKIAGPISRSKIATGAASQVVVNDGSGNLSSVATIPVAQGGTGASTAAGARTNLGLGGAAVANIGYASGNVMPGDGVPVCFSGYKLNFTGIGPTYWSCIAEDGSDSSKLPLAGGTMVGAIEMSGYKVTGLPTPVDPDDAANKDYVDNKISTEAVWSKTGGDVYRASGRVGVGTTSPSYQIQNAAPNGVATDLFLTGVSGLTNGFGIQYNGATTGDYMKYYFLSGNVGLDTVTPPTKLSIVGTDKALSVADSTYDYNSSTPIGLQIAKWGSTNAAGMKFHRWTGSATNFNNAYIGQRENGNGVWGLDFRVNNLSSNTDAVTSKIYITADGVGFGTVEPAANVHLKAGTTAASTAPLKFSSGPVLTTPEAGAIEYDGSNLFYTDDANVRKAIATSVGSTFQPAAGSAGSPAYTFSTDTNTGFYSSGADQIGISAGGSPVFTIGANGIVSPTNGGAAVSTAAGTAAAPTFSFGGDADTGWYSPGADMLAASTAGTERVRITPNGSVGIGTATPGAKLSVNAGAVPGQLHLSGGNLDPAYSPSLTFLGSGELLVGTNRSGGNVETDFINSRANVYSGGFRFYDHNNSANTLTELVSIAGSTGNMGIGANATNRLTVRAPHANPTATTFPGAILIHDEPNSVAPHLGLGVAYNGGQQHSWIQSNSSSGAETLSLQPAGGAVGIGTPDSNGYKLRVLTSGQGGAQIITTGATIGNPTLNLHDNTNNVDMIIGPNGANGAIGNYSVHPLQLITNQTPRVTIAASSGDVGIGYTNPLEKLDVNGTIRAGDATSTSGSRMLVDNYSAGHLAVFGTEFSSGSPQINYGVAASNGRGTFKSTTPVNISRASINVAGDYMSFFTGPVQTVAIDSAVTMNEVMRLTNGGLLGIGTSNPQSTLDVGGTSLDAYIQNLSTWGLNARTQGLIIMPEGAVTDDGAGNITFGSTIIIMSPLSGSWVRVAAGTYSLGPWGSLVVDIPGTTSARATLTPSVVAWNDSDRTYAGRDRIVLAQRMNSDKIYTRFSTLTSSSSASAAVSASTVSTGTIYGGSSASGNLIIDSTSNATKGNVVIAPSGGNVGIGTSSPYGMLSNTSSNVTDQVGIGVSNSSLNWNSFSQGYVAAFNNTSSGNWYNGVLAKIADTSSNSIIFNAMSGTTSKFLVLGNGNVGIGTSAPTGSLDVMGNYGDVSLDPNSVATANFRTPGHVQLAVNTQLGVPYTTSLQAKHTSNTGNSYPMALNPLGGNVGIGTTTPAQRLSVVSSDYAAASFKNNGAGSDKSSGFSITNGNATPHTWNILNGGTGNGLGMTDSQLYFESDYGGTVMTMLKSGNVGIGTIAPGTTINQNSSFFSPAASGRHLDVASASSEAVLNLISGVDANDGKVGGVYFSRSAAQTDAHINIASIQARQKVAGAIAGGELQFFTKNIGNNSGIPAMTINHAGNIGVGTDNPGSKLAVSDINNWNSGSNLVVTRTQNANSAQGIGLKVDVTTAGSPINQVLYGLYSDVYTSGGGSTNYGLYVNRGMSYFGDRVGISTDNPSTKLQINHEISPTYPLIGTSVYGAINLKMPSNNTSTGISFTPNDKGPQAGIYVFQNDVPGTTMHFATTGSYASGQQTRMTILPTGEVGIGTVTPDEKLNVNGNLRIGLADTGSATVPKQGNALIFSGGTGVAGADNTDATYITRYDVAGNVTELRVNIGDDPTTNVASEDSLVIGSTSAGNWYPVFSAKSGGNVGIGTTTPSEKLEVNGNAKATAFLYTSDVRLKKDIKLIENPIDKIMKLKGVEFKWKSSNEKTLGFIAQDVEKVLPEIVKTDKKSSMKSVQYANITAVIVEAFKDLVGRFNETDRKIASLEKENAELKARLDRLEKNMDEKKK